MSQKAVMEIIERATADKSFQDLLFSDAKKALTGYSLTDEEQKMLSNLNADNFDNFAGNLGDRTTKGGWVPGIG